MADEQLPSIYRTADARPVTWGDAMKAWEPVAEESLRAAAIANETVSEAALAALVQDRSGIRTTEPHRVWLGRLLAKVDKTVAAQSVRPRAEIAAAAQAVLEADPTADPEVVVAQLAAASGPPLVLSKFCVPVVGALPVTRAPRATRSRDTGSRSRAPKPVREPAEPRVRPTRASAKAEPQEPVICATCYTQLPTSGICDFCG